MMKTLIDKFAVVENDPIKNPIGYNHTDPFFKSIYKMGFSYAYLMTPITEYKQQYLCTNQVITSNDLVDFLSVDRYNEDTWDKQFLYSNVIIYNYKK